MSESVAPESSSASPTTKPRSLFSPLRIVLFAILAVMVVGLVFDQRARSSASAAFELLDGKLGPDNRSATLKRSEVPALVGRQPEQDANPNDEFEIYVWPGVLRPQTLYVQYLPGEDGILVEVSRNEPLPGFAQQ